MRRGWWLAALALMPPLAGCMGDGGAGADGGEAAGDATEGGNATAGPFAWYPYGNVAPRRLFPYPQAGSSIANDACCLPTQPDAMGPFNATEGISALPEGTRATWHLYYTCENPGPLTFGVRVFADGVEVGSAEGGELFVGTFVPAVIDEVELPMTLAAVPDGALLSLEFSADGCVLFGWGRGGSWATRLEIEPPGNGTADPAAS